MICVPQGSAAIGMAVCIPFCSLRECQGDVDIERCLIQRCGEVSVPADRLLVLSVRLDLPRIRVLPCGSAFSLALHVGDGDVFLAPVFIQTGGQFIIDTAAIDCHDSISRARQHQAIDYCTSLRHCGTLYQIVPGAVVLRQIFTGGNIRDDVFIHLQNHAVHECPIVQTVRLVVVKPHLI